MEIHIREATRRAIGLLTAADSGGEDLIYDKDLVNTIIGDNEDERYETVIALASIACGAMDLAFQGNSFLTTEYIKDLGSNVDELPEKLEF